MCSSSLLFYFSSLQGGTTTELELHSTIDSLNSQLEVTKAAHQAEKEKNDALVKELSDLKKNTSMLLTQLQQFEAVQQQLVHHKKESESLVSEIDALREENIRLKNDVQNLSSVVSVHMVYWPPNDFHFLHYNCIFGNSSY